MTKLRVRRTISFWYETEFPGEYPDMTLDEAVDFEYKLDEGSVIELTTLGYSLDLGCIVRVVED